MERPWLLWVLAFAVVAALIKNGLGKINLEIVSARPKSTREDTENDSQVTWRETGVNNSSMKGNATCIRVPYPAGWGNAVLKFLYLSILNEDNGKYPCVSGYSGVFGRLFKNVKPCPLHLRNRDCFAGSRDTTWSEIREVIKRNLSYQQELVQLNFSYVEEVLARANLTAAQLRISCAVHLRFGDAFTRGNGSEHRNQVRLCSKIPNQVLCFKQMTERVKQVCPHDNTPIYMATDYSQFATFFAAEGSKRVKRHFRVFGPRDPEANKRVISHKKANEPHIKDIGIPLELENPTFESLLCDWLALVLAKTSTNFSHSTFSETALLLRPLLRPFRRAN